LLDIPGYVAHAEGEMNMWITKDRVHEEDGDSVSINVLVGTENWTGINSTCLNTTDIFLQRDSDVTQFELLGEATDSESGSDSDSE
jgi:hypothetical protein